MSQIALTDLQRQAIERLRLLEMAECFDGAMPGSRPNEFQQKVIDDWGKVPTQAVTAGNQSGKSQLGARLASWFLAENKPGWKRPEKWGNGPLMGLLVGRTMKQVEEELVRKIQAFFTPDEIKIVKIGMIPQKIIHNGTGNQLLLASHHNENEAREKLQAFVLNFEWLDEMPKSAKLFEELERRVQTKDGWFISTFTPKVKNIDIRKTVDAYELPFSRKYKMPMFANPALSEERKAKILQELEAYPESYRNCVLNGDWLSDDLAVYHLDPDKMIQSAPNYSVHWRHVESSDPALQSKHGLVVFAQDPKTHFWYIRKASYITGVRVPEDLVKTVADSVRHLNVERRVCDAASTWYIGQAYKMGFSYMTPYDKNNRRAEMMKNLQQRLGVDVFIDPEAGPDFPDELSSMEWSETQVDKVVNSRSYHLHDAAIYGLDCLPKDKKPAEPSTFYSRLWDGIEKERRKATPSAKKPLPYKLKYRW